LRTNGDAIFGTRPWSVAEGTTGEELDVRFTRGGESLYAIVLGTPSSNVVTLPDVQPADGAVVELVGRREPLAWKRAGSGIEVELAGRPPTGPAITLRVSPAP
jgi:alpha-L-fucosidase